MSPSSAPREPLEHGSAPWSEEHTTPLEPLDTERTRPLPRTDHVAPGRAGVASGRLHRPDPGTGVLEPVGDDHLTPVPERVSATAAWDTTGPATPSDGPNPEAPRRPTESVATRQRERFGGLQLIPGLFGWLSALSVTGLLLWFVQLLAPLAPAAGLDTSHGVGGALDRGLAGAQEPMSWIALAVLVGAEFLAFLAGGYVAGRMARFSGATQGVGVWLWSLLGRVAATVTVLLGAATADSGPWTLAAQSALGSMVLWGLVALIGMILVDLIAAVLGGTWGTRYHRRVDDYSAALSGNR